MPRRDAVPDAAPDVDPDVDLDAAVAALYAGPPDAFVSVRDGLARRLRTAGRRDDAAEVKALRKPRVLAWALNAGRAVDPAAVTALGDAAGEVGDAQSGGGDLRGAIAALRDAERAVVDAALAAARDHDQTLDPSDVAGAVRAVVSDSEALAELRSGRLQDVPTTGGLGLGLAGGTDAPPVRRSRAAAAPERKRSAKAGLATAQRALDEASAAAEAAARSADEAAAAAEAAEEAAQRAQDELAAAERAVAAAREDALALARTAAAARREARTHAAARDRAEAAVESARDAVAKRSP